MEKMKKTTKKKVNQHLLKRQVKNILIDIFFQRRDGSKIELIPTDKYTIEGQAIYKYRVQQYYQD